MREERAKAMNFAPCRRGAKMAAGISRRIAGLVAFVQNLERESSNGASAEAFSRPRDTLFYNDSYRASRQSESNRTAAADCIKKCAENMARKCYLRLSRTHTKVSAQCALDGKRRLACPERASFRAPLSRAPFIEFSPCIKVYKRRIAAMAPILVPQYPGVFGSITHQRPV